MALGNGNSPRNSPFEDVFFIEPLTVGRHIRRIPCDSGPSTPSTPFSHEFFSIDNVLDRFNVPPSVRHRLVESLKSADSIQDHCLFAIREINKLAATHIPYLDPIDEKGIDWINRRTNEINEGLIKGIIEQNSILITVEQTMSHPAFKSTPIPSSP